MISPIEDSLRSIIRHGLALEAQCRKCGRKVILDPQYLVRRVDPKTSIHALRLACSKCYATDATVSAYPPDWKEKPGHVSPAGLQSSS